MWCASCQTDVAGEVSADGQSVLCTTCGGEVSSGRSLSLHPKTRDARELLERWSTEELLDPDVRISPPARVLTRTDSAVETTSNPDPKSSTDDKYSESLGAAEANRETSDAPDDAVGTTSESDSSRRQGKRRKYRLDHEHQTRIGSDSPVPAPHPRRQGRKSSAATRIDAAHEHAPTPHFNIASAFEGKTKPGQGESLWGQILAYTGVGLLTVGTVMVLWGYFGGPESYTPTGWLLASAGQMLLFLGVVTLVSGGMEQTTHEVSRRIEYLGDQLVRFEQAQQHILRGPHFDTRDESDSRQRQKAEAESNSQSDG